jgi:hypothetical protein
MKDLYLTSGGLADVCNNHAVENGLPQEVSRSHSRYLKEHVEMVVHMVYRRTERFIVVEYVAITGQAYIPNVLMRIVAAYPRGLLKIVLCLNHVQGGKTRWNF